MPNTIWSRLSHLQLGRYAEYYAKMEFASYGYDVYTSEVDDHGVDFVARNPVDDRWTMSISERTRWCSRPNGWCVSCYLRMVLCLRAMSSLPKPGKRPMRCLLTETMINPASAANRNGV